MIQPTASFRPNPAANPAKAPASGNFARSLAAVGGNAGKVSAKDDGRQADADDGKTLPDDAHEPPLAWLPTALMTPPAPVPHAAEIGVADATPGSATADAAAPAAVLGDTAPVPTPPVLQSAILPTLVAKPKDATPAMALPQTMTAEAPRSPLAAAASAVPVVALTADPPLAATPALQVFAAAMRSGLPPEQKHTGAEDPTATPIAAASTTDTLAHAVAATGDAQQAPLDMRRDQWPHAMIDRIEALRDAADATDSRIRLVPDALGSIDVSVKREGDTVHVHFAADQATTRTLLTDAQPRLAEIAASRGLKLGQASVDAGTSGQSGGSQPRSAPILSTAPLPAAAVPADEASDFRLA